MSINQALLNRLAESCVAAFHMRLILLKDIVCDRCKLSSKPLKNAIIVVIIACIIIRPSSSYV
jgi:hypothetical protein